MNINLENSCKDYVETFNKSLELMIKYSQGIQFEEMELDFLQSDFLDLSCINKSNGIYLISITNAEESSSSKISQKIISLKKRFKKYKFPRVNSPETSSVLYIGKSKGNMKRRVEYHLGLKSPSTYSLQLGKWKEDKYLKDIKLKIHYCFFDEMSDDEINSDILELLETALHKKHQPILGRSGH